MSLGSRVRGIWVVGTGTRATIELSEKSVQINPSNDGEPCTRTIGQHFLSCGVRKPPKILTLNPEP